MVQGAGRLGLLLEATQPLFVLRKLDGRTLIATSRFSRGSFARYTSPIPPAPTVERISYGPSRVPGERVIYRSPSTT